MIVEFTLEKCKYYYLEIKITSEFIGSPTLMNYNNDNDQYRYE